MYMNPDEEKELNREWRIILIIWGAIFASLGVYLGVCLYLDSRGVLNIAHNLPLKTLNYALLGISGLTVIAVYFLRKFLKKSSNIIGGRKDSNSGRHPAAAKYSVMVLISSALIESIGIYGVVIFLLSSDISALFLFLGISCGAMIYFRPRKKELFEMANQIKTR